MGKLTFFIISIVKCIQNNIKNDAMHIAFMQNDLLCHKFK